MQVTVKENLGRGSEQELEKNLGNIQKMSKPGYMYRYGMVFGVPIWIALDRFGMDKAPLCDVFDIAHCENQCIFLDGAVCTTSSFLDEASRCMCQATQIYNVISYTSLLEGNLEMEYRSRSTEVFIGEHLSC